MGKESVFYSFKNNCFAHSPHVYPMHIHVFLQCLKSVSTEMSTRFLNLPAFCLSFSFSLTGSESRRSLKTITSLNLKPRIRIYGILLLCIL